MSSSLVWRRRTLAEAGVQLIDCDHRTPTAAEDGYPYIAIPQLKDGHIALDGARRITETDYLDWTRKLAPQVNDVIVVRRCNSGQSAHVPEGLKCAIGQNLVVLRADGSSVLPSYLRWLVRGDEWWQEVGKYINVGAVFDSLRCRDIPRFELPIPPLSEQAEIAETLAALDDRITLLRETNTTLESIAQALFKSWFVDFDPVRAKMEGRVPEGMDEETAALFPDGFEQSELGLVPRGWHASRVANVACSIFSGGTPDTRKSEYWHGDHKWFSSGETRETLIIDTEKRISAKAVEESSTRLAIPGDILIASAGQGHTRGQTSYCGVQTYINQSVVAVRADNNLCPSILLFWNLKRRYSELRDLSDSHSSRGSLTTKLLAGLPILTPGRQVARKFADIAGGLINAQANNCRLLSSLSQTRDTILPRLISGQLRLPEAQAELEAVA